MLVYENILIHIHIDAIILWDTFKAQYICLENFIHYNRTERVESSKLLVIYYTDRKYT